MILRKMRANQENSPDILSVFALIQGELEKRHSGRARFRLVEKEHSSPRKSLSIEPTGPHGLSVSVEQDTQGRFAVSIEGVLQRQRFCVGTTPASQAEADEMRRLIGILDILMKSRMLRVRSRTGELSFQPRFAYLSGQGFRLEDSDEVEMVQSYYD